MTSGLTLIRETPSGGEKPLRRRRMVIAAVITIVLMGFAWWSWPRNDQPLVVARSVTAAELEATYGVTITLVAESGGGGMVDFRFRVTDVSKAQHIFHADMPMLVSDDGSLITMSSVHHAPQMVDGGQYFMLYGNANGVVRAGEQVSIVIGDLRLDGYPVS